MTAKTGVLPRYSLRRDDDMVTLIIPALAAEIGLNESIFLMQIGFLCNSPKNATYRHQIGWHFASLRKLHEDYFPYWGIATINRIITALEIRGLLIVTDKFNAHAYDKTRWFTLNMMGVCHLKSLSVTQKDGTPYPWKQWFTLFQNETALFQDGTALIHFETPSRDDLFQNGSTIQESKETDQKDSDLESRDRTPAPAPTPTPPTATDETESTPVVEEESAASATVTAGQPPPPVAPPPAPADERRCEHCDRMRPRSAFYKTGWKQKWARDDQLDERCALCRADKPHLPADDLPEYQRRQDAAAKGAMEDAARKRAMTAAPAEADRIFVANHPLWIAFADAWAAATVTPDHPTGIRPVIENAAAYRDYLVQLEEQGAKPEHMSALASQKLKAGKATYSLKWAVADIVGVMTEAVLEQRKPAAPPTPPRVPVYAAPVADVDAPNMTIDEIKALQKAARAALIGDPEQEGATAP